jgi:hypothetical protein
MPLDYEPRKGRLGWINEQTRWVIWSIVLNCAAVALGAWLGRAIWSALTYKGTENYDLLGLALFGIPLAVLLSGAAAASGGMISVSLRGHPPRLLVFLAVATTPLGFAIPIIVLAIRAMR